MQDGRITVKEMVGGLEGWSIMDKKRAGMHAHQRREEYIVL
jgi:hypothetical protein